MFKMRLRLIRTKLWWWSIQAPKICLRLKRKFLVTLCVSLPFWTKSRPNLMMEGKLLYTTVRNWMSCLISKILTATSQENCKSKLKATQVSPSVALIYKNPMIKCSKQCLKVSGSTEKHIKRATRHKSLYCFSTSKSKTLDLQTWSQTGLSRYCQT